MAAPGPQQICSYASVTLAPGQQFTLPPGATIIAATSTSAFTSTCPIPTLEVPECYIIGIIMHHNDNRFVEPWTNNRTRIDGIFVGGVFYDFGFGTGAYIGDGGDVNLNGVSTYIQNNPSLKGLITCIGTNSGANGPKDTGGVGTICFKTIPSVAKTMSIQVTTGQEWDTANNFISYFPARKINTWALENAKCGCSC
jgi:hypothetical protein